MEEEEKEKEKRKEKKFLVIQGQVSFGPSWFWVNLVWAELVLGRDDSNPM